MRKPCSAATPVATPTRPGSGISAVAGVAGTPAPVPSSATASTADRLVRALQGPLIRGDGELGEGVRVERSRREVGGGGDDLAQWLPIVDAELERFKALYRDDFGRCFREALAELPARERTLLRLNIFEKLSIDKIGALFSVHRATAARWLERAKAQLAERTETLLGERLAIGDSDVASIIRLVRSEVVKGPGVSRYGSGVIGLLPGVTLPRPPARSPHRRE